MLEYLREKIANNGKLFLQETHSFYDTVINWRNDFKGELFFSHGTINSCGVMIGYLYSNKINRIKNDNQGRILVVDADIDEEKFVLINLYNANTETEQIKTIYGLDQLLGEFCLDSNKKIILAGDFNLLFEPSLEASGGKNLL